MDKFKVCACIITYNHEKFIKKAIEGAVMQKIDFDYEIIINEDCSTDSTRSIIKEYKNKYPDLIKFNLNEKNLGLTGNWVKSLKSCDGKYIAILEGDDYWTDPNKLQMQIDFLENNPEYVMSMHNVNILRDGKIIGKYCKDNHPEIIDFEYLLSIGSGGPTCSLVIKNETIKELPDWFDKMYGCDWTVQVISAQHGKMKYFDKIMGVYRKHGAGALFSATKKAELLIESKFALPAKNTLKMIDALSNYFDHKYDNLLNLQRTFWYDYYINEYLKIGDYKMAKQYAKLILSEILPSAWKKLPWLNLKNIIKYIILSFLPFCGLLKIKI